MSDIFPEDPTLTLFSRRFIQQDFDPTAIRPLISPATQARPKALPSLETLPFVQQTPPTRFDPRPNSPKRALPFEDSDTDAGRPRKLARGESPLKGAAGRRLDQQKRNRQPHEVPQLDGHALPQPPPPPALPREVLFLLSIIPKAETYLATKFRAEEMVRLIREKHIPATMAQLRPPPPGMGLMPPMPQMQPGQYNGRYSFSRLSCDHSSLLQRHENLYHDVIGVEEGDPRTLDRQEWRFNPNHPI